MSLDRSLRVAAKTSGKRSVMTRAERVAKMVADKKFDLKSGKALGIPKTLLPKA
ncbi:MAG: small basic protein [Phycisphaeraceae bacterium]|nr:small basic protein [Phycisphaerae bacterium]MBX3391706.1 small basic protein [Phycisphaeraceae bacterium]HRJ49531.1 small basic protein [Phycisphaerales bacterium]